MTATRLKVGAGMVLAVAFLLPQYTCTMYHGPDGTNFVTIPEGADAKQYVAYRAPRYAWEGVTWRDPSSWLAPVAFLWPLPLLALGARSGSRRLRRLSWALEPLLLVGSTYVIWAVSSWGQRAIGAYLGFGANGLYSCAWLQELWVRWPWPRARA